MAQSTHPAIDATPDGFEHRFHTVDGVRLHYVEGGRPDGHPLVLIAGYPESWYAWRKTMSVLGREFRIVAVDLPGQGDSDKPLDGYDTHAVASCVHTLIRELGIRTHGVVGHDIGAWVAFSYAQLFQGEISRLVLLDAGIPGITLPELLPTAPERAWRTWHFAFHSIPDLPEALIGGKERIYLHWFLRRKTANPFSFSDADLDEYERVFTLPGALRAGLAFYRAAPKSALENKRLNSIGPITVPLLAMSADQGSIPDMASPLKPFATDVHGMTIAQCGHFMPEEQPAAVAEAISRFFGEHS